MRINLYKHYGRNASVTLNNYLLFAQDLFPGIDCPEGSHEELSFAIQYVTAEDGYSSLLEQVQLNKCEGNNDSSALEPECLVNW